MVSLRALVIGGLALLASLTAQTPSVESIGLLEYFDSRSAADQFNARLAELSRESNLQRNALGNVALANQIDTLVANLTAFALPGTPLNPASGPELHVVGFYEPNGGLGGSVTINVERQGAGVWLYAQCYDAGSWTINAAPGVNILGIIIETYDPITTVTAPAGVPVSLFDINTGGNYEGYAGAGSTLLDRARLTVASVVRTGLLPKTITGDYTAPATLTIGETSNEWRAEFVKSEAATASLLFATTTRAIIESNFNPFQFFNLLVPSFFNFSATPKITVANPTSIGPTLIPNLPSSIEGYTVSPRGNLYVRSNGTLSLLNPTTFAITPVPGSPSRISGLTYDVVADRVLVTENSGAGTIQQYDEVAGTWATLASLNNTDALGIIWNPGDGLNYILARGGVFGGPLQLRSLTPTGTVATSFTLGLDTWDSFSFLGLDTPQLYAVANGIQIVGPPLEFQGLFTLRHAFLVNPLNGDIDYATVYLD